MGYNIVIFRFLFVFICLGIGIGHSGYTVASEPSIYSKMLTPSPLGNNRVLVLCLLKESDEETSAQFYESVVWGKYVERDLIVVEVSKSTVRSVFSDHRRNVSESITKTMHHDYGDALRKKANCKNELEYVLIGKDTGVKARWLNNFAQEDLFNRIDAMPMRRYEMRQRADKD